ncbi:hypothetical protein [Shinella sp.]
MDELDIVVDAEPGLDFHRELVGHADTLSLMSARSLSTLAATDWLTARTA